MGTVKETRDHVAKVTKRCSARAKSLAAAAGSLAAGSASVKTAAEQAARSCKREKQREKDTKFFKKKLHASGPTFKFPKGKPCIGGKGSFSQKLKMNARVNVGVIPAGQRNVVVRLRSPKDVDAGLWTITKHRKRQIAIIAWRIGKIDSPGAASLNYAGAVIKYSGYNGISSKNGALNFGHEDIRIVGKAKKPFMMTAFAYEAGTANIEYSWGPDPAKCKAQKARQRKEQAAKHAAKVALKKKVSEGKYKSTMKVLHGSVKGCKGAKKWASIAKTNLAKAVSKKKTESGLLKKCSEQKSKKEKKLQHGLANVKTATHHETKAKTVVKGERTKKWIEKEKSSKKEKKAKATKKEKAAKATKEQADKKKKEKKAKATKKEKK